MNDTRRRTEVITIQRYKIYKLIVQNCYFSVQIDRLHFGENCKMFLLL